jgi:hypothetical protein
MAITTLDQFIAATRQRVIFNKTQTQTSVALQPCSVFDRNGAPGAGVLAGTSTTTGVVPTDATAGCPTINTFGGGNTGYVARIEANNSVICRMSLFDCLWKGGAYAFNVNTSGNSPTSFSSRVPGGTNFTGLELWYEQATAGTLVQNVNVTYINQDGTTGRSTGTVAAPAAMIISRMFQLPLQAGDKGIQGITGVVGSVASAGTFNLLIMRPIAEVRIKVANEGVVQDMFATGMPVIYDTSALMNIVTADSTSSGLAEFTVDIING